MPRLKLKITTSIDNFGPQRCAWHLFI